VSAERNVELVRRATQLAQEEGPRAVVERFDEFFTEGFQWKSAMVTSLEGGHYVGQAGFSRYWDDFEASFAGFSVKDTTFRAVGDDAVLVTLCVCVEGVGSRVPVEQEVGWLFRFEGDKAAECESYLSWAEAEEAARA
jgi:hypothetical protein